MIEIKKESGGWTELLIEFGIKKITIPPEELVGTYNLVDKMAPKSLNKIFFCLHETVCPQFSEDIPNIFNLIILNKRNKRHQ